MYRMYRVCILRLAILAAKIHTICTTYARYAQDLHTIWKHIHTIHTHTYHIWIDPLFICVCMLYVLQKVYIHIYHSYIPNTSAENFDVSACMACMCMYMPVSACMNLNMHVASSNKWIVPKFLAGSLRSSRPSGSDGQGCARAEQYTQLDLESRFHRHGGANPCPSPTCQWIPQAVPYIDSLRVK